MALGLFGVISDRGPAPWVAWSIGSGLCTLALAAAGLGFGGKDYFIVLLAVALAVFGATALAFGMIVALVNRRPMAFRSET
jgi:hypothetical protein